MLRVPSGTILDILNDQFHSETYDARYLPKQIVLCTHKLVLSPGFAFIENGRCYAMLLFYIGLISLRDSFVDPFLEEFRSIKWDRKAHEL